MLPGLFNAWNLRPNALASLSNSNESKHESEQKDSMPDTNKSIIKLKLPKWLPGEQVLHMREENEAGRAGKHDTG